MRQALDKTLRKTLERTVIQARDVVELAARESIDRFGIGESSAPAYLKDDERKLRNRLRAHGRALGDTRFANSEQEVDLLVREVAYEHWHRMLFARYLEQNDLLMYDAHTAVTLEECTELAEGEAAFSDGWEFAGHLAQKMLPQIFRTDSPVFAIKLAINHVRSLETLVMDLSPQTFKASDSLGWCYQFWQSKRKDEVNASGVKIGARELSPVTQLFTEPYMVSFLLDNALGAWWANRRLTNDDVTRAGSEKDLRQWAAIDGVPLNYLRLVKEDNDDGSFCWSPAAGAFEQWPNNLSELKTLDPCCGSGHFLVAVFLMLVPMRMALEDLSAAEAVDQVLRQNIHGLELDQRCVELAAFALALEAWRFPDAGGYRVLPELNLACTGLSVKAAKGEWKALGLDKHNLKIALDWMYDTFEQAPVLGSLINPRKSDAAKIVVWDDLQDVIGQALQQEEGLNEASANREAGIVASGLVKAARMLAGEYQWVVTNVPYKKAADLCVPLQVFLDRNFAAGSGALETAFFERCVEFAEQNGTISIVMPQNWMFLTTYTRFREKILYSVDFSSIARLGAGAFETISGEVVKAILFSSLKKEACKNTNFFAIDTSLQRNGETKSNEIRNGLLREVVQSKMLDNPDYRIVIDEQAEGELFSKFAGSYVGLQNGDTDKFVQKYWEHCKFSDCWRFFQMPTKELKHYDGKFGILRWENGQGELSESEQARIQGVEAWKKKGIVIRLTKPCPATLYSGDLYDQSSAAIIPKNSEEIRAIYTFTRSELFREELEKIDQKRNVTNATFIKVPIDLEHWQTIAEQQYPNGLPRPYTNDPTQWIYHGHPCGSVIWHDTQKQTAHSDLRQDDTVLQTSVARLLGYRWPAETDPDMELAPQMREWVAKCSDFEGLTDDDGIACLPAVRGELSAADRLVPILEAAYGKAWNIGAQTELLKSVKASSLEVWLRDKFFVQHCKLFQNRPFIWQVWDGLKDGFSALVNYHKLDHDNLDRLIYTYLGDWIRTQEHGVKNSVDGSDIRLVAAQSLKCELEAIKEGEAKENGKSGYDIFVRWKPIEQQPLGWQPDVNDGVRLNIRPFMTAVDMGKKGAGVLRDKPNIHWKKDRGNDVVSAPWYTLGEHYSEKVGARINDHHLTLAEKKAAREEAAIVEQLTENETAKGMLL